MEKITSVIVDDHHLFRRGVVNTFLLEDDFEVLGEASNGDDALTIIRKKRPQVVVMDVNLPGMNGQQVTRQVMKEGISSRIILLTAYDDIEQVIHSMRAGAAAFCAKHIHPEKLIQIVRTVADGKYVVGEDVFDAFALDQWLALRSEGGLRSYSDPGEPYHPPSKREMEVLTCLTQGMSNKEIAISLGISHQTVKNHVTSILRKLGVEDRTQAAVYALRRGWVRLYEFETYNAETLE
jgi:DNA-binding NarL/FixJ family response regulator